jgi:hypothetical protein
MNSNDELSALSRRLRAKSALLLDADLDFAFDLMRASLALDEFVASRQAADIISVESVPLTPS